MRERTFSRRRHTIGSYDTQKHGDHPVQGLPTFSNVCIAVLREAEQVEEEWSPRSVNVVVFHSINFTDFYYSNLMTIRHWKR